MLGRMLCKVCPTAAKQLTNKTGHRICPDEPVDVEVVPGDVTEVEVHCPSAAQPHLGSEVGRSVDYLSDRGDLPLRQLFVHHIRTVTAPP